MFSKADGPSALRISGYSTYHAGLDVSKILIIVLLHEERPVSAFGLFVLVILLL